MTRNTVSLLVANFVASLGAALPYPVLAPLFLNGQMGFRSGDVGSLPATAFLGLVLAAYPFGQFVAAPMMGKASDRYGRRPVLIFTTGIALLGNIAAAMMLTAGHWYAFMLARFITGCSEGNGGVIRAAAVDHTAPAAKVKMFAYINASFVLGYMFGPLLGGFFADSSLHPAFNARMPFLVAAFSALVALVLFLVCFRDQVSVHRAEAADAINTGKPHASFFYLFAISFILTLSLDTFYEFYPVVMVTRWHFNAGEIALMTMLLTSGMVFTQLVLAPISRRWSSATNIVFWGSMLAVSLAAYSVLAIPATAAVAIVAIGLAAAFVALYLPVYISDLASPAQQGEMMSRLGAWRYFGDAAIAGVGGFLANRVLAFPLYLAAGFAASGTILFKFYTSSFQPAVSSSQSDPKVPEPAAEPQATLHAS